MAIIKDIIADEERAFYAAKNDTFVNIRLLDQLMVNHHLKNVKML